MKFSFALAFCVFGFTAQVAMASEGDLKYKFYQKLAAEIDSGFESTQQGIDSDVKDMKANGCTESPNKEPCPEYASEIKTLKMDLKVYQKKKDCVKLELESIKSSSDHLNKLAGDVNKISNALNTPNKSQATQPSAGCAAYSKEWADKYEFYVQANKFVSDKEAAKSFSPQGSGTVDKIDKPVHGIK